MKVLKAAREAIYNVRRGREQLVVELLRTPEGKTFVSIHKTLRGAYKTGEGEKKEWDLFEREGFKEVKESEVEYETLPPEVRKAISSAFRY